MTNIDRLRTQLHLIEPVNEREVTSIEGTLDRLTWPGCPFDEEQNAHHVTASAFVISPRGVIMHRHRRLNIWVQPGGHVDAGEPPQDAAVRETFEETGLLARHLDPVRLFHVDVHPGPREHTHYDLRYILVAPPVEPSPPEGESPDVFWFDFGAAQQRCEPTLVAAIAKLAAAIATFGVPDLASE